jgi:hypothetical protein
MVIRTEQMQALSAAQRFRYVQRMVVMLRKDFPEAFPDVSDPQLEIIVSQCLQEATGYGLREEPDLTLYVRLQAILGPGFDTHSQFSWTREILGRDDLSGTRKMDIIHDRMVFSGAQNG